MKIIYSVIVICSCILHGHIELTSRSIYTTVLAAISTSLFPPFSGVHCYTGLQLHYVTYIINILCIHVSVWLQKTALYKVQKYPEVLDS